MRGGEHVDWVEVPAGVLRRGTPVDEVAAVARRYADTGVPTEWYMNRRSTWRAGRRPRDVDDLAAEPRPYRRDHLRGRGPRPYGRRAGGADEAGRQAEQAPAADVDSQQQHHPAQPDQGSGAGGRGR